MGAIILGGVHQIDKVAEVMVAFMTIMYLAGKANKNQVRSEKQHNN
ncbi:alanine:cation symporter family protein [Syntrophomonas erecta subsp. sporosyntropha]